VDVCNDAAQERKLSEMTHELETGRLSPDLTQLPLPTPVCHVDFIDPWPLAKKVVSYLSA